MIYVYGFCDGNSVNAVAEYQLRFPNRWIPTRRVFTAVYETLRDTGTLPGVCIAAECDVNEGVDEEEGIVQMVRGSPCASTRRIARCVHVPHTRGWRTLHAEGMYPYHVQQVQHLGPVLRGWNFARGSMAVASCIVSSSLLMKHNSIVMVSIIHTTLMCGQMRIPTSLSKATFNYVLMSMCGVQFWPISWLVLSSWKVVLQERHTSDFCKRNCPDFWRMCLWINEVVCISNMMELLLILHVKLEISWTIVSLGDGSGGAAPPLASQVSRHKPNGLFSMGMDERTGLQCDGGNARCIAWSHFGCRRPYQKQSAEAAKSNSHSSQSSGSLCCGQRWHFQKRALSTDQFKLKVISWNLHLYFKCIMYYAGLLFCSVNCQ